jgi:hypothetical protein
VSVDLVDVAGRAGMALTMSPTSARPAGRIGTSLRDRDFVFVTNNASDFPRLYAAAGFMLGSSSCSRWSGTICRGSCFARRTGSDRKPIDQVLEFDLDGEDVIVILYDLPAGQP